MRYQEFVLFCCLVWLGLPTLTYGACGEGLEDLRQELTAEEQALRTTEQALRAGTAEFLSRATTLRETLAHPPASYDRTLAHRLGELRRTQIEPKRARLERLRAQHEEARYQ